MNRVSGRGTSPTHRRRLLILLVAIVSLALIVTMVTGLPAPGAARRYPYSTLQDLSDRANAEMDYPPQCPSAPGQPVSAPSRVDHPPASVDLLRSRVVVPSSFAVKAFGSGMRADDWVMLDGVSRRVFIGVNCAW